MRSSSPTGAVGSASPSASVVGAAWQGEGEKAERIIRTSLEQHGLTLERARARYGKRRVSEARKWAETVAFFATGCSFLDIAEVVDRSVAQVSKEIYDTWCEDYYIGCVDNIAKLAFDGYLVREQGLDEDGGRTGRGHRA